MSPKTTPSAAIVSAEPTGATARLRSGGSASPARSPASRGIPLLARACLVMPGREGFQVGAFGFHWQVEITPTRLPGTPRPAYSCRRDQCRHRALAVAVWRHPRAAATSWTSGNPAPVSAHCPDRPRGDGPRCSPATRPLQAVRLGWVGTCRQASSALGRCLQRDFAQTGPNQTRRTRRGPSSPFGGRPRPFRRGSSSSGGQTMTRRGCCCDLGRRRSNAQARPSRCTELSLEQLAVLRDPLKRVYELSVPLARRHRVRSDPPEGLVDGFKVKRLAEQVALVGVEVGHLRNLYGHGCDELAKGGGPLMCFPQGRPARYHPEGATKEGWLGRWCSHPVESKRSRRTTSWG